MIKQGKANIIIDGQWGSTGKGKLAGYLYNQYPIIDVAVGDFMPNAGHTYIDDSGNKFITKMLPTGSLIRSVENVIIGPYAVIDVDRLKEEIKQAEEYRGQKCGEGWFLFIHPMAGVLNKNDIDLEKRQLFSIASTMTGGMAATVRKMERIHPKEGEYVIASNVPFLKPYLLREPFSLLDGDHTALLEMAQGFDLSLNYGYGWPYVTSRDCLAGRGMDNAGFPLSDLGNIIASLRTYPIRVGNVKDGWSGPHYDDQEETSWEKISEQIGRDVIEYTTVTKRVRRVFTFSYIQLGRFLKLVNPDFAFLNFINYIEKEKQDSFIHRLQQYMYTHNYNCRLSLIGYGARNNEMDIVV